MARYLAPMTKDDISRPIEDDGGAAIRQVVHALRRGIPLAPRPFAELGRELGMGEAAVLGVVHRMLADGTARRFGAVFDARRLGYRSELCAMLAGEDEAERLGALVAAHPGVTHCYLRGLPPGQPPCPVPPGTGAAPNLWFTLAVLRDDFAGEMARLQAAVAPTVIRRLPAVRRFKIDVAFDPERLALGEEVPGAPGGDGWVPAEAEAVPLCAADRALVRALAGNVRACPEFFAAAAAGVGWTEEALLSRLRSWRDAGILRRLALVVRHRRIGLVANAMCLWPAPEEAIVAAGRRLASWPAVTHCYERQAQADWPYTLYAMIHAADWDGTHRLFARIGADAGLGNGRLLGSLREFKRTGMQYFAEPAPGAVSGAVASEDRERPAEPDGARVGLPSLPVNLLLGGSPALVVGGGPVAWRKAQGLLAAAAAVTVVSPDLCPGLADLVAMGKARHEARLFRASDTEGMRVVFAATDNRAVNRQVLAAARASGALCCCVDGNWPSGDFVTPATLHQDGFTVAVSTGGRSCRQARLVKETLGRHLQAIGTADLVVVGVSHEQVPQGQREAVQLVGGRLRAAGAMLMHAWGIHEFLLLVTCNRVELVAVASADAVASGLPERILGFDGLPAGMAYQLTGAEALAHLALVTAGMRSQAPGEHHVAGQVKAALRMATENGWAGGMLQAWVAEALHISKHIRNEVGPSLARGEIEDQAMAYAMGRRGEDWRSLEALVIGAGALGRALVERILARRPRRCRWCHHVRRPDLPDEWRERVEIVGLDDLPGILGECGLVFCAAETAEPVLRASDAPALARCPALVIDLGMPRNLAPDLAARLAPSERVDLEGLKHWTATRDGSLERALARAREIVAEHKDGHASLMQRFQGGITAQ